MIVGAHRGAKRLSDFRRGCIFFSLHQHGFGQQFDHGPRVPTRRAHFRRRRLRLAPGGPPRCRGPPGSWLVTLPREFLQRPLSAAVFPVPVGHRVIVSLCWMPPQAVWAFAAPAVGETRGGSSVGHPTSCGNRARRNSLWHVRLAPSRPHPSAVAAILLLKPDGRWSM